MGILQALFGQQTGQAGVNSGFTPVAQLPQTQVQQAPQTLGLVQDILSQRFQPQPQDVAQSIFMNGTGLGTNGGITTPEAQISHRLAPVMEIAKTLGTLNQSQLEISKLNEQMRHDRATEGSNPFAQPLTVGPGGPSTGQQAPQLNIPSTMQGNAGNTPVNNPGNLRPVGSTGGFQQFATPQDGDAAMTADLIAKVTGKSPAMAANFGPNYQPTLRNIITTYAPPNENNTEAYISSISQQTGIAPDQVVSPADIAKIQPAMVRVEQGSGQATQPQQGGQGFMPVFKGNEVLPGAPAGQVWVANPNGGVQARIPPGAVEKGANGEILSQDAQGNITQQIPQNPAMKQKFEQNIQQIAKKFEELKAAGGTVEEGGGFINNKLNQATSDIPGGQALAQGSKAQTIRDEIQSLIKQTTPLYMQAMGITPGMERAVSAQQMLQAALGGALGKTRQENLYSLSNLSKQAGTGELAQQMAQQPSNPQIALQHAQEAIKAGAPRQAVIDRLTKMGIPTDGL